MTEDQIKHMTERFLSWKLPADFNPDAGISFEPIVNSGTVHQYRHEPVGTNLFSYAQAEAMVRYMLEGAASPSHDADRAEKAEALLREARWACFRDACRSTWPPERENRFGLVARIDAHLAGEPGQGDEARAALSETRP